MKIKRLKKIKINSREFSVIWDKDTRGGHFSYGSLEISIGTLGEESEIFEVLCHELMEIVTCELYVRHPRDDCGDDYIFVYDHRQHTLIVNMFSCLVAQFIK